MGAIGIGEWNNRAAIEMGQGEMDMVGVLARVDTAYLQPEFACCLVKAFHFADYPISVGDGFQFFAGGKLEQVQVVVA